MKVSKAVYVRKCDFIAELNRDYQYYATNIIRDGEYTPETSRYEEKTHEVGCQYDCKRDNRICTCRNPSPVRRRQEVRYFGSPKQIYAYQGSRSFTEIGVGSVKALQRKKVKRIYLPETSERGVGSSDLSSYILRRTKQHRASSYYETKRTSSKCVGGLLECNTGCVMNEKLSPIVQTISGSTSYRESIVNRNIEIGSSSVVKNITNTTTQVEKASKKDFDMKTEVKVEEIIQPILIIHDDQTEMKTITSRRTSERKPIEKTSSSDSLLQHVHNLENPSDEPTSHLSLEADDLMENKLEIEYRSIFAAKSKSKDSKYSAEKPTSELKSTSTLKRRFEALRRGLAKRDDSKKNAVIVSKISSQVSGRSHKDVSINSDPPSLEGRSFSNTKPYAPFVTRYSRDKNMYNPRTSHYRRAVTNKKERTSADWSSKAADDDSEGQGVKGMFKLWGKKFNLEDDHYKRRCTPKSSYTSPRRSPKNRIDASKVQAKTISKPDDMMMDEKREGRKFFFFKKKNKEKHYKAKKGVTAGRCEVRDGLVIKILGGNVYDPTDIDKDTEMDDDSYEEIIRKSWLKKFLTPSIDSRHSVKVRWNNKRYAPSSSTVFELMDNIYKDSSEIFRSKSQVTVQSSHKSYTRQHYGFVRQNIEAWMIPKTITDRPKLIPVKQLKQQQQRSYKSDEDRKDNMEVRISDQKWFIDKSKAFSHKIEVVLHSKNFRKLNKEESSEYLRIDIPKGFFVDSSSDDNHRPTNQSSDEEVYKIVEYETASDLKKDKAACNFNIGDHKQNTIKVTVSVKESKKCVSKVLETINRQPTSRDVVIQGSNVLIPKRCDVIGVGIITQRDLSQIRKPILKIQDDFSDEESEHNILRPHGKKCEFAESYLQEYYRHWTPLGIDLYSWCVSDSQLKCCSEHSRSSYVYPGVVTKSCPNILDDFQTSAIVSSCGNPSCSQCQYKQQDCSKPPPPSKCAWFKNKKKSGKNGVETRVCPKDSIEVFKARKIYAATLKAKWCSPCMDAEQPEDCEQKYPMSPESRSGQNLPTTECPKLMKPCCRPLKPKPKPAPFKKHVSMPDCEEMNERLAKQLSSTMPDSILQFKGVKPTPPPCEVCQKIHNDPKHATINSCPTPALSPTCLPTCVKPPSSPSSPCKPCPSNEKPSSCPATPPVCEKPPTPPCKKIPSCPPTPTPSKKPLRSRKKLKSPPPCPSTPPPCPKSPPPCPKSPPPCPNSPPPCPKSPPTCPPTPPSCPSCPPTPPSCPVTPPSGSGSPRSQSPHFSTPLVCPPKKPSSCPSPPKKPPCCTPPKKPPCCTPPKKPPCCTPPKKPPSCPTPPKKPSCCATPPKKPSCCPSPKKPSCCPAAAKKSPCCPLSPKRSPTGPPTPKKPPCCNPAPKKPAGGCLKKPLICLTSPQKSRNGLTPPPCPRRLPCCSPDTPSMDPVPSFTPCPHIHIVECPPKPCPGLPPPPPPEICCCPPIRVKKPCPYTPPCPSPPPCPKPCPKPLCPLSPSCPPPPCSNCPFSNSQPPCPHTKSCPPCPPTSCVKKPKCPHTPPCPPPPCPPPPCPPPPCPPPSCSSPSCPPKSCPPPSCSSPSCPPKPCPPKPCPPKPCPPPPCPPPICPLPFCPLPSCAPKPCFPPPCPPKPCFPPPCPPKPCFPPPCPPKPCFPPPCPPPLCPLPFCPPKPGCWKPLQIPSMCPSPISCCEVCKQPRMKPCITSFCRSLDCQQSSVTSISQAALHADAPFYYSPIHPCPPEPKVEPKKRERCKTPPCKFDDDYPWPIKDQLSNSSSAQSQGRCKNDCPMLPNMSCETIPSPVKQECRPSCPNYQGSPRLPCLSKLPEMQCPPVQTPPPLRLPSLSRLPTEPSKASGITIPSRSKSKVSGLHLKMMPAPPAKKPVCSTDCLTWDNEKQDDGCISLSSKEKITIRLKKDTPSTEEIREGFNIKVQDEDGMTLFERKDYRLQHAGVQRQSSLVGEVYKASEVRRVTTNSSDQALGTDKDNDKLKDINEVSSVASIANQIEIQFKLKVTQGDKVTEINISDDGENTSKKNYEHKATKQKSQEVFVVKNEPAAGHPDQNNDINIRIVIKNFKPKSGKKKTVNLSDDYSEFSKKISAKFHTVSTGYSDIFHDDNVFSVHRATVDLTSSVDNIKTTIENNGSVEVMSKPENELGGVILMGSECRCITTEMLEDKSEDTEAKSYPSRKYSASKEIQENQEETDTQLTDHKYEYNEDTDTEKPIKYDTEETDTDRQVDPPKYDTEETDTEKQADKKYDNLSTTDTDEPDALPEIKKSLSLDVLVKPQTKDEKKKLLKQVFEKVHDTKYKNKTRMRKLRDMLKVILTSDSSDRDDTKVATSELATDVTYASLKPNYFRDSDSMNNYYRVESNPVLPEAAINRQVVYPTMENNSDCSNSVHSVEVLSSEAESPNRGGCMCSTLAARLKLASRIGEGGGCCCGTKRMTKKNEETTCDLKRESDYLTHIDYKTNEFMDVQTQNSRYLTSKINSTNLSVHDSFSPSIGDSVDDEVKAESGVLNVDSKKFNLRKTFSPERCHIRQCEMRKRNRNTILSISDEDKIVFLSGHSTRVPIENVTVKPEKKDPIMRIDAADILQSYETKKAVLEIYTEKTISDDGEHLVAKLPKFVYDREQEIQANYEAMATNTYKTVCKKNIVMMAIKR